MQKQPFGPFRTYIGLIQMGYLDPEAIHKTISQGILFCTKNLASLDALKNAQNILLKADLNLPLHSIGQYNYTHPSLLAQTIKYLLEHSNKAHIKFFADSNLYQLPTKSLLRRAHYLDLRTQNSKKIQFVTTEDYPQTTFRLTKESHYTHNEIKASQIYNEVDFSIYCPKVKTDHFTDYFSGAIRMGAPTKFNSQIVDMLEVCSPQLIISDGIVIPMGGGLLTQKGHELGVILISNNAVAHDLTLAKILNLNSEKISHLQLAIQRKWGPSNLQQIEFGGANQETLSLLSQKIRFWNIQFHSHHKFIEKLPFEIINSSLKTNKVYTLFKDWLYSFYDLPNKRLSALFWPKLSICIGKELKFPHFPIVFVLGNHAIFAMKNMTYFTKTFLIFRKIKVKKVQLKSGRKHLLIEVQYPNYWNLSLLFFIFSLGRIRSPFLNLSIIKIYLFNKLKIFFKKILTKRTRTKTIPTNSLQQNKWWSTPNGYSL